jgi:hypothetical protein
MAALQADLKCSHTGVYAPLSNRLGALPLNVIWAFSSALTD